MKKWLPIIPLLFFMMLTSCASKKNMIYFQGQNSSSTVFQNAVPKIQINDMVIVNVSSSNSKAAEAFAPGVRAAMGNPTAAPNVYTVYDDGTIALPFVGKIKIAGLTRTEAAEYIKEQLKDYIIDAGVNVSYANFKISVLGEVGSPGTFTLPSERVTILEALALAGDLTIQGKRKNIMVIRETATGKQTFDVDITGKEVLDSPVYYLAQNDVVYVEPNGAKVQSSIVNYTAFLSVAGLILSIITFATR